MNENTNVKTGGADSMDKEPNLCAPCWYEGGEE